MKTFFRNIIILFSLFFLFAITSVAQTVTLNGYIKDMEGIYIFEESIPTLSGEEINTLSYN
ncbi:MAG: hypothetical protein JW798_18075, partial [Prolixibacteraceae bacterium]|nr:hypothetical protein [Prolixibacteraceae bacterium]